jgi:hypothetical protein
MSTTTGSPARRTRSPAVWCGLAPFGPDDREVDARVAFLDDRVADVGCDLLLGPARAQPSRYPGVHAVDRLARGQQRRHLGRALARPQITQCSAGQHLLGRRQGRPQPQDHQRPHPVRQSHSLGPAEVSGDQRVRILGLLPAPDLDPERARGRRLRGREL